MGEWFRAGGFAMWPIALLAVLGVPGAIGAVVYAASAASPAPRARAIGGAVALAGVVAALTGVAGYTLGMRNVEAAVAHVAPEHKDELLRAGTAEAEVARNAGGALGVALMGSGLLAVLIASSRRKPA